MSLHTEIPFQNGFAEVNGLRMYYELYGEGEPLVLLHGGASTIQTSFGRVIPFLAQKRRLICMELQAHGRTGDRDAPISFQQDADDVAALLVKLGIQQADLLGFSNGGMTALQLAIRHPRFCNRVIAASVLLKRNGAPDLFWEFMRNGTFNDMPQIYKEAFLALTPDPEKLMRLYRKCSDRMVYLEDFPDEQLQKIKSPVLFINAVQDVGSREHMEAMVRLVPGSSLVVLPGGHGGYLGEATGPAIPDGEMPSALPIIDQFLSSRDSQAG
ncbi:alpha/beta hydrolase [Ravibacter arvi]|uniref:Alpha/beta hydrolase n=1 Tax=Ravibacter arvi TaxID=2051041 RepID=A0ABP8LNU8_9BACT